MSDLVARIRAEIDLDEQWALACNRPYEYAHAGSAAPATGVHWQWVTGEDWEPVTPDPMLDEFVAQAGHNSWLVTVETWPSGETHIRQMPRSYADTIIEMDSAAAGHITRHDPARVLATVAAHRKILDEHQPSGERPYDDCTSCGDFQDCGCARGGQTWPCPTVLALAAAYGIDTQEQR